jgi:hypothetical protein
LAGFIAKMAFNQPGFEQKNNKQNCILFVVVVFFKKIFD